jgi:hypothetical protein
VFAYFARFCLDSTAGCGDQATARTSVGHSLACISTRNLTSPSSHGEDGAVLRREGETQLKEGLLQEVEERYLPKM